METQEPTHEYKRPRKWKQRAVAFVGAAALALGLCPADTQAPNNYQPSKITVVGTSGDQCAANDDVAVVNVPGLGQNNIGELASPLIQEDLQGEVGVCIAGFNPGTQYDPRNYAEVTDQFIEKNHLKGVIFIARSLGGIAVVDMLRDYGEIHPNSGVKFSIIFMASPSGPEDLQPLQQVGTVVLSVLPPVDALVYAMTAAGMLGQGDLSPFDPRVWTNIANNAENTPATLIRGQAVRLMEGSIGKLPKNVDITSISSIGDKRDEVVKHEVANKHLEEELGQKFQDVVFVNHSDTDRQLSSHADDWLLRYAEYYKKGVLDLEQKAINSMALGKTRK